MRETNREPGDSCMSRIECIEHSIHSQQKKSANRDEKQQTQETDYQSPSRMTPEECIEHSMHSGIQKYVSGLRSNHGVNDEIEMEVNEAVESDFLISPRRYLPK